MRFGTELSQFLRIFKSSFTCSIIEYELIQYVTVDLKERMSNIYLSVS